MSIASGRESCPDPTLTPCGRGWQAHQANGVACRAATLNEFSACEMRLDWQALGQAPSLFSEYPLDIKCQLSSGLEPHSAVRRGAKASVDFSPRRDQFICVLETQRQPVGFRGEVLSLHLPSYQLQVLFFFFLSYGEKNGSTP